jgi:hypothetical protein
MQNERKVFSYSVKNNNNKLSSSRSSIAFLLFFDGTQPWKKISMFSAKIEESNKKSLQEAFYDEELKVFNDSFSYFLFLHILLVHKHTYVE